MSSNYDINNQVDLGVWYDPELAAQKTQFRA